MNTLLQLFATFFGLAFISFGGVSAILPELHRLVVFQHGWMSTRTFTELFAVAQAAPGPNVLIVALIGQHVAGWTGALAATIGICLPMSLFSGLLFKYWDRMRHWRGREAIQLGVTPLAVGLVFSSGVLVAHSAEPDWRGIALVVVTVIINLRSKIHPLWLIALGALLGVFGWV